MIDTVAELPAAQGTIPPAIAEAVVKVMASIKRLARSEENKFARYQYTSIDGFLEATGPLCAVAGLFILSDEGEPEISQAPKADREGTTNFLTIRWAFTLAHSSGVIYGPLYRTVTVPAAGAQAFGASQSYALKQFMRGLFQIPTGDNDDPDKDDKHELPESRKRTSRSTASKPACPSCGKTESVIVGKEEYGGGFVCFAKKGGCGHKWKAGEEAEKSEPDSDPVTMAKALEMIATSPDEAMDEKISQSIKTRQEQGYINTKDAATLQANLLKRSKLREPQKTPLQELQWAVEQCKTDKECEECAYMIEQAEKKKTITRAEAATLQDSVVKRQAALGEPATV